MWVIREEVLRDEVIPACRQVAEEKGIALIDTRTVFEGRKDLFVDGCHPSRRGARLLAETVYAGLTSNK